MWAFLVEQQVWGTFKFSRSASKTSYVIWLCSNDNEMSIKFMVFKIFFLQFNWLGSNKKRSDNQANSRWWLKNSGEIIPLDGVRISLYNLGVYFQSNTGKLISQLITLVVAVKLFSFFGDENWTSNAKIGSTINVKIGIMLDWIYILAEINHS